MKNSRTFSASKRLFFVCLTFLTVVFSEPSLSAPTSTAADGEWKFPGGTPEGSRYSNLMEITPTNVATLKELFTIPTGISGGHQGQPLVVNISSYTATSPVRLFYVTPYPNNVKAIDPATGVVLWTYTPPQTGLAKSEACCDAINRGLSYTKGKIIFTSLSGAVYALNATTGALLWSKTGLTNPKIGETVTAAPVVVEASVVGQKDLVIVGVAGAENGVRGWIQALDINNKGASVWKKYSTGSDVDVGFVAGSLTPTLASSFTSDDSTLGGVSVAGGLNNLGCRTWGDPTCTTGNMKWQQGGGSVWAWITFDPVTRIIYYGTANPGVWNPSMRPGSNKWSSSVFARNVDTGNVVWINQLTPHDGWDYDSMNESIIVTDGGVKQVVHFDKNGFAYRFNAADGSLIHVRPFSHANWAQTAYDSTTGMPLPDPAKLPVEGINSSAICPSPLGGKEFAPAAYSPVAGLFFIPGINMCSSHLTTRTDFIPGTPFVGDTLGIVPDFDVATVPVSPITPINVAPKNTAPYYLNARSMGELIAWNPTTGKAWARPEAKPLWGGMLATAGDGTANGGLVFYGNLDNHFKAVTTGDGTTVYDKVLECGILGNPISFTDAAGKQKIAVFTGVGWLPGMFSGKQCPGVLHIFGL